MRSAQKVQRYEPPQDGKPWSLLFLYRGDPQTRGIKGVGEIEPLFPLRGNGQRSHGRIERAAGGSLDELFEGFFMKFVFDVQRFCNSAP